MCTHSSGRQTLQTGVGLLRSRDGWAGLGVASQERDVQGCSHAAGQGEWSARLCRFLSIRPKSLDF